MNTVSLCPDCYVNAADGKTLDKLGWRWLVSSTPEEPHFSNGGWASCGGCFTRLGGDRYTCEVVDVLEGADK